MRIIECTPFFNENLIAGIHIEESSKWVDEIHVTESDYTFQYKEKSFLFNNPSKKVIYHKLNVEDIYKPSRKYIPYIVPRPITNWHSKIFRNSSWYNEASQRNYSLWNANITDNDIIILSDIDEIIDPQHADRIIEETKKRGIVTIKIHFTLFYFNLFSQNWGGPKDYSYRIFSVKGDVLRKKWKNDSDWLRKEGEHGELMDQVHCFQEIMGFHHSWLGDENKISQKINAYAHIEQRKYDNITYVRECIKNHKSIFPGHELLPKNNIKLLDSVEAIRDKMPELFI